MDSVIRKRKRNRRESIIDDASSSEEEHPKTRDVNSTPDSQSVQQVSTRSSERLQKKRSREFHMPIREDVWENITPTKSPGKYEHLRPKSLVNNFTKENNRYNYDPNETSGDESMDDFLNDSLSESSSSSEEQETRIKPKRHVKGRHQRLQIVRSDSDESSNHETMCNKISRYNNEDVLSGDSAICVQEKPESEKLKTNERSQTEERKNKGKDQLDEGDEQSETDDEIVVKIKKHNKSLIESDESLSESDIAVKHKKGIIESDDNDIIDECNISKQNSLDDIQRETRDDGDDDDDDDIVIKRKLRTSILESDEDSNDGNVNQEAEETIENIHEDDGCKDEHDRNDGMKEIKTETIVKSQFKLENDEDYANKETDSLNVESCFDAIKQEHSVEPETTTVSWDVKEEIVGSSTSETSDSSEAESGDDTSSGDEISEEYTDSDENGCTSRVRVQMLKKKQKRNELFEKFRKERERKLSKEHKS